MTSNLDYQGFNVASYWNGQFGSRAWLESLSEAKALGANTIALTSTSYVYDKTATNIYSTQQTESLENVGQAVVDAKANGFDVVLKPHIDQSTGEWRGRISTQNAEEFLANYKKHILEWAKMGEEKGADILILTTELDQFLTAEYRDIWEDIIAEVRSEFSGQLSIAANWDAPVAVFDLVDIIGINPYVALDTDGDGSVAEYMDQWHEPMLNDWLAKKIEYQSPFEYWKGLAETYDKPVMFTELGYRSMEATATRPMDFNLRNGVDETEQAELFEAFYRTFANEDWVNGSLVWDWSADRAASEKREFWDSGYTVEGKEAEAVLDKWYDSELGEDAPTKPLFVSLAGNTSNGAPEAVVVVDRVVVARFAVENGLRDDGFVDYEIDVPAELLRGGEHSIEVHFANPAPGRGLHVDALTVEGVRYEAEAFGSGTTHNTAYSVRHVSEIEIELPSNADDDADVAGEQTPEPVISLSLAANIAGGDAEAAVYLDGVRIATLEVGNTTWREGFLDYEIDVDPALLTAGDHKIEVQFLNPHPGRGLHVDAITIGGNRYEAEDGGSSKSYVTAYNSRAIADVDTAIDQPVEPMPMEGLFLRLAANTADGPANAAVLIDGVEVGMVVVGNRTWREGFQDYEIDVDPAMLTGDRTVEVKFVNPAPGRGLHVDAITVNGTEYDVTGKNGAEFLTAYNNRTIATVTTEEAASGDEPSVSSGNGPTPEEIGPTTEVAFSMAANIVGDPSRAEVFVDGKKVATFDVVNTPQEGFRDYTLTMDSEAIRGDHDIEIVFANHAPGRGLHLDAVTIGETRFEAEVEGSSRPYVTTYVGRNPITLSTDEGGLRVIEGTNGADLLFGTDEDDWMIDGRGADRLTGGEGSDTFQLTRDKGVTDTITDYEVGVDSISLQDQDFVYVQGRDVAGGSVATLKHDNGDVQDVFMAGVKWWEVDQDFVL